ncbi:MAG: hypothetical protein ACFFCI_21990 [Promethearchaeota archaeon]
MKKLKAYTLSLILITVLGPAFVIFVHYTKTSIFNNYMYLHDGPPGRHYNQFDFHLKMNRLNPNHYLIRIISDYSGTGPYITDGVITLLHIASGKTFNYSFYMRFSPSTKRCIEIFTFIMPAGLYRIDWNGNNSNYIFEFYLLSLYNWDRNYPSMGDLIISIFSYLIVISFVPCLILFLIKRKNEAHN